MKKKLLFYGFVICEFIAIIVLGVKLYEHQKQNVLGTQAVVVPIRKEFLIFPPNQTLKYYYEPKPSNVYEDKKAWLSYIPIYTINADGINSTKEYDIEKQEDTFRIIALGDSFTFGAYVYTQDNYPSKLEKLLNSKMSCRNIKKFEVINLGVSGYDIQYSVERFIQRGIKYNPDLVLWLLTGKNLQNINEETQPIRQSCWINNNYDHTKEITDPKQMDLFINCWNTSIEQNKEANGPEKLKDFQLQVFRKLFNLYSGKLIYISTKYQPKEDMQLLNTLVKDRQKTYYYDQLIDVYLHKETLPDNHPTAIGYTLIVEDIYNYLLENKIIPCEK